MDNNRSDNLPQTEQKEREVDHVLSTGQEGYTGIREPGNEGFPESEPEQKKSEWEELKKYFNGRSSRKEYWVYQIFWWLWTLTLGSFSVYLYMLAKGIGTRNMLILFLVIFGAITLISATSWIGIAVRRLHDSGYSGKFIFCILLPVFGWIQLLVLMCQESEPRKNKYGTTGDFRWKNWYSPWLLCILTATFILLPSTRFSLQYIGCRMGYVHTVTIPDGVSRVSAYEFAVCNALEEIKLPRSLTWIEDGGFSSCKGLEKIKIPEGIYSIGEYAFAECTGLDEIKIPSSINGIGEGAFARCYGLKEVTFENGITEIPAYLFVDCSALEEVTLPNSVKKIGEGAFSRCTSLTKITIPDRVTIIEADAFSDCVNLKEITIPASVTKIGYNAFSGCRSLTTITIPDSVTSIDSTAFSGCSQLKYIDMPKKLKSDYFSVPEGCHVNWR